jgi:hypothetical protein
MFFLRPNDDWERSSWLLEVKTTWRMLAQTGSLWVHHSNVLVRIPSKLVGSTNHTYVLNKRNRLRYNCRWFGHHSGFGVWPNFESTHSWPMAKEICSRLIMPSLEDLPDDDHRLYKAQKKVREQELWMFLNFKLLRKFVKVSWLSQRDCVLSNGSSTRSSAEGQSLGVSWIEDIWVTHCIFLSFLNNYGCSRPIMRYLTCSNGFCHLLLNPLLWIEGDSSDDYPLDLLYENNLN